MRDAFPLADGFVISCPAMALGPSPVREIRKRGNIPLVLQDDVVVELKRADMVESWRSTCALARGKAESLMKTAAGRISDALLDEDTCDIERLAEDMAAFFLLAVRNKGLNMQDATRYCALAWQGHAAEPLSVQRF
jgi:hypothetical protein